jgi:hypothetical protein
MTGTLHGTMMPATARCPARLYGVADVVMIAAAIVGFAMATPTSVLLALPVVVGVVARLIVRRHTAPSMRLLQRRTPRLRRLKDGSPTKL